MPKNTMSNHYYREKLIAISLIITLVCAMFVITKVEAADTSLEDYVVQRGDTLISISKKFNLKVGQLMAANNLESSKIIAGSTLKVPVNQPVKVHLVSEGDNLSKLSKMYGSKVHYIKAMNSLNSSLIRPGDSLKIPVTMVTSDKDDDSEEVVRPVFNSISDDSGKTYVSNSDLQWLAKLIHAEARGESFEGKVAVGAVILNRLDHPEFPRSIEKIIFQKVKTTYQFTPVKDGRIYQDPTEDAYKAAEEALRGVDPTGGAIFFYNPKTASDRWIRTLPVTKVIGNHVFAK